MCQQGRARGDQAPLGHGQGGALIGDPALRMQTVEARLGRAQVRATPGGGRVQRAGRTFHEIVQTLTAQVDEPARIAERGARPFQTQAQGTRLAPQGAAQAPAKQMQLGQKVGCHRHGQLGRR